MVKYIKCHSSGISRYYMETREGDGRHTLFFDGEPLWITYEPVYGTDFMKTAERMFQLFVEDLQNCHINGKHSSPTIPDVEFCDKLNILNDKEKIIKAIYSHLQWVYA